MLTSDSASTADIDRGHNRNVVQLSPSRRLTTYETLTDRSTALISHSTTDQLLHELVRRFRSAERCARESGMRFKRTQNQPRVS